MSSLQSEDMNPHRPDQPDNYNRHHYADMAVKLYGGYAPTKVDVDIDRREMTIEITADTMKRIEQTLNARIVDKNRSPVLPEDDESQNEDGLTLKPS